MTATGLSEQALVKLARRRQQISFQAAFVVLIGVGVAVGGHGQGVDLLVFAVALLLVTWLLLRVLLYRGQGGGAGWLTQMPVWALRVDSPGLRSSLRDTSDLTGRLTMNGAGLRWVPSKPAQRLGAATITWPRDTGGWACARDFAGMPMTYLRLTDPTGVTSDLWIRARRSTLISHLHSSVNLIDD
jgi:hypothetical protein